jgi:hypothetical protein
MAVDDALHRSQAEAVPGFLRREERLKDAVERRFVHAWAVVTHGDVGVVAR